MKKKLDIIKIAILIAVVFGTFYTAQSQSVNKEDIIKVNTNLVRMAFIAPWYPSKFEVFDDNNKIENYEVANSLTSKEFGWVMILDLNTKKQDSFFFDHLKKQIRSLDKKQIKPLAVIVNLEEINFNKAKSIAEFPKDWNIISAENQSESIKKADTILARTSITRQGLFWLTAEDRNFNRELFNLLPASLKDKGIFTYIGTIRKPAEKARVGGKKAREVGYSNIWLNTTFSMSGNSNLIDYHFNVFTDQCQYLHVVYYDNGDKYHGEGKVFGNSTQVTSELLQSKKY